jgi:hypothetical protein
MNYQFLILSQKSMLKNQVLEEMLRERSNYYFSKSRPLDFWILISPAFLSVFYQKIQQSSFFLQNKQEILSNEKLPFYSLIISSNSDFIQWIKLRLGYFIDINDSFSEGEKIYTTDGIFGSIDLKLFNSFNFLSLNHFLHPDLFSQKYKQIFETYYSF